MTNNYFNCYHDKLLNFQSLIEVTVNTVIKHYFLRKKNLTNNQLISSFLLVCQPQVFMICFDINEVIMTVPHYIYVNNLVIICLLKYFGNSGDVHQELTKARIKQFRNNVCIGVLSFNSSPLKTINLVSIPFQCSFSSDTGS